MQCSVPVPLLGVDSSNHPFSRRLVISTLVSPLYRAHLFSSIEQIFPPSPLETISFRPQLHTSHSYRPVLINPTSLCLFSFIFFSFCVKSRLGVQTEYEMMNDSWTTFVRIAARCLATFDGLPVLNPLLICLQLSIRIDHILLAH